MHVFSRSSPPKVFLGKGVLKICSKFTEHPCQIVIYWNRTSACVFSCKFAAYFLNTFIWVHVWRAASDFHKSFSLEWLLSFHLSLWPSYGPFLYTEISFLTICAMWSFFTWNFVIEKKLTDKIGRVCWAYVIPHLINFATLNMKRYCWANAQ